MKKLIIGIMSIMSLNANAQTELNVDNIGVDVSPQQNREYSFTDKKAGFWYGRTHQDTPVDWYAGWNIAKKRILSDFTIYVDGKPLKRSEAKKVEVYPNRIEWQWDNSTTESLAMVDYQEMIIITLNNIKGDSTSISLTFPDDAETSMVHATKMGNTFLLTYGNKQQSDYLAALYDVRGTELLAERKQRMNDIICKNNPLKTNLPSLDKSLAWLTLTTDELLTEQQGRGIYAGLPWFNEYWGRDMFIAMPGAALVTGQFAFAKSILTNFAKFQDKDESSPTCGRIPNRANLEGILYNTADGTPRYVMEIEELLKYSGIPSILKQLYKSVVLSIDESLKHVDKRGYLPHDDADTWMDVKRNGIPGSPRGNRANDVQYLWYCQLESGINLARRMNDIKHTAIWRKAAKKLVENFEKDFCNKKDTLIYDHLNADGTKDTQFRPNQLYCFDLIEGNEKFKQLVTRRCWENLVYPWGVASLAQWDKQFHPQHENWHWYHKDDAYHNGTVWLWNNGIAMQRMIEFGQQELAWKLFKNMNVQAMEEGAVGSLSENADAHPRALYKGIKTVMDAPDNSSYRKNGTVRGLSGTFLQAWSNSEQLRVWYQYFLGIRPDLMNNTITIEPRLPREVTDVETSVVLGKGKLHYSYHNGHVNVSTENVKGYNGQAPVVNIIERTQQEIEKAENNPIFKGLDFCHPVPLSDYPCFKEFHDPALTY